jgi:hypothetical protein
MGSFINSQADNEICEVLNKRFSDDVNPNDPQKNTYLDDLRAFFQNTETLFDGNHQLHRVFHRLAITVTGGASVPKTKQSRLRWFHLLHGNLPAAVDNAIRGQLTAILSPAGANPAGAVAYVTFSTVHVATHSGDQFELYDGANPDGANHYNNPIPTPLSDANGKSYCALILQCNVDQYLPDGGSELDPPKKDGGEKNIPYSVSKAPKKSAAPKPAAKKSAKKKKPVKKKKAVKKKAKKATKKTAKKAGKGNYPS